MQASVKWSIYSVFIAPCEWQYVELCTMHADHFPGTPKATVSGGRSCPHTSAAAAAVHILPRIFGRNEKKSVFGILVGRGQGFGHSSVLGNVKSTCHYAYKNTTNKRHVTGRMDEWTIIDTDAFTVTVINLIRI